MLVGRGRVRKPWPEGFNLERTINRWVIAKSVAQETTTFAQREGINVSAMQNISCDETLADSARLFFV
jgi:hypothetical protein